LAVFNVAISASKRANLSEAAYHFSLLLASFFSFARTSLNLVFSANASVFAVWAVTLAFLFARAVVTAAAASAAAALILS